MRYETILSEMSVQIPPHFRLVLPTPGLAEGENVDDDTGRSKESILMIFNGCKFLLLLFSDILAKIRNESFCLRQTKYNGFFVRPSSV